MKTAIAIRHVAFEGVGGFAAPLAAAGYRLHYVDAVERLTDEAEDADLLIVLGGPIGADADDLYPFLKPELALIERRLAAGRPMMGICLGAPIDCQSGRCRRFTQVRARELGFAPITLTKAGATSCLAAVCRRSDHAALACRYVRSAGRRRTSRLHGDLREPGLRTRPQRYRLSIPPGSQRPRYRALAGWARRGTGGRRRRRSSATERSGALPQTADTQGRGDDERVARPTNAAGRRRVVSSETPPRTLHVRAETDRTFPTRGPRFATRLPPNLVHWNRLRRKCRAGGRRSD